MKLLRTKKKIEDKKYEIFTTYYKKKVIIKYEIVTP